MALLIQEGRLSQQMVHQASSKEFQTKYAMAKLLPELTANGCVISTLNHEVSLSSDEAKKLSKAIYRILKVRLEQSGR